MKRLLVLIGVLFVSATMFAATQEVMIQGFAWNSAGVGGWWGILNDNAARIAGDGFTVIWMPPPSRSAADAPQGYMPNELYNLDASAYGTQAQLQTAISTFHVNGMKVLADLVLNHRVGTTDWADFTDPVWNTWDSIVADDEWTGAKSSLYDTGEGSPYARDMAHDSGVVSQGYKDWMQWLKNTIGFDGWRYDFVKGYAAWAVGMYNDYTPPTPFSVGEYWDYNAQNVVDWIDGTEADPALRAHAFDFPLRDDLYNAVANGYYNWLSYYGAVPGVLGMWPDKAVTFIENHDTEEARNGAYAPAFPDADNMQGYAYILTHPGTPCVFWHDVMDSSDESAIKTLISIRKQYGITSESAVSIAMATANYGYAAYITGLNGTLAMKIGPGAWSPDSSYTLLTSGNNYAVWGK